MKTNKYTNMLVAGAFALALASCVNDNDWGTDSNYSRPFSPGDISVSANATYATIEFDPRSSVDYYLLELSPDTLYQDDFHQGSRIDTVRTSPYTLTGLSGETVYFLRMKSVSSSTAQEASKWSYYEDGELRSFETKGEQIFETVEAVDRSDTWIRLRWAAGEAATHIIMTVDGQEQRIALTAEQIAEGVCLVEGLNPSTTYTFTIYNDTAKRGTREVTTAAAMPEGDLKYTLGNDVTLISDELIESLVELAVTSTGKSNVAVTIGIPAGQVLDVYGGIDETNGEKTTFTIPDGASVTFFGLAGAEKPTLNFAKTLEIGGTHSFIRFESVKIVDAGTQYLINQANEMSVNELSFKDCEIPGLTRSLVRLQGSATKTIGTVSIDNCVISDQGSGTYAFLYWNNAAYTVSSVVITNSTFDTMAHSFADVRNSATASFAISNCTFYNVVGSGRYFLDARSAVNVKIENSLFGKTYADGVNGVRLTGTAVISDVYKTSDCNFSGYSFAADRTEDPVTSAELFADPNNGDFTVLVNKLKGLGDPRWNNE